MLTVADQNVDPPEPSKPCYCDLQAVRNEIENALNDALYAHGLEWNCSVKMAGILLFNFLSLAIETPTRCCEKCRPDLYR